MSDAALLDSLDRLVREERRSTVKILRHLDEADRRGACIDRAYSSLFAYCVKRLGYSEGAAARRVYSARRARDFPIIYRMLAGGEITLASVYLLSPHLTPENHFSLLREASGKSKREVEAIVARLDPRSVERDAIRMLGPARGAEPLPGPARRPAFSGGAPEFGAADAPARAEISLPFSAGGADAAHSPERNSSADGPPGPEAEAAGPWRLDSGAIDAPGKPPFSAEEAPRLLPEQRVRFAFTADEDLLRGVERAREILRHKFPAGRLPDIFTTALSDLLDRRDPARRLARLGARRARRESRLATRVESPIKTVRSSPAHGP